MAMDLTGGDLAQSIVDEMDELSLFDTPSGESSEKDAAKALALTSMTVITKAILNYLKDNVEVSTELIQGIAIAIAGGVPAPTDGGAALQTTQLVTINANPQSDSATGEIK